jgi:uracil DNA glycosylase
MSCALFRYITNSLEITTATHDELYVWANGSTLLVRNVLTVVSAGDTQYAM